MLRFTTESEDPRHNMASYTNHVPKNICNLFLKEKDALVPSSYYTSGSWNKHFFHHSHQKIILLATWVEGYSLWMLQSPFPRTLSICVLKNIPLLPYSKRALQLDSKHDSSVTMSSFRGLQLSLLFNSPTTPNPNAPCCWAPCAQGPPNQGQNCRKLILAKPETL